MNQVSLAAALIYSLLFGLLHGIIPDEHTWPIVFSYAIGGASGREGIRAGLYFSAAFTFQRALLSEAAYLALAPFLLSPRVNGIVYIVVGIVMSAAGIIVVRRNTDVHLQILGPLAQEVHEAGERAQARASEKSAGARKAPPTRWTLVHGFVAGFGFGAFSLFVNTVAAPAMPSAWLGFLPGLLFGLGTMAMVVLVGLVFGASLRWTHKLTEQEVGLVGARTGGRTLLYGGVLFAIAGVVTLLGLTKSLPVDFGYVLIGFFMIAVAVPSFVYSWREVRRRRLPEQSNKEAE
jgi:hypothetical protein